MHILIQQDLVFIKQSCLQFIVYDLFYITDSWKNYIFQTKVLRTNSVQGLAKKPSVLGQSFKIKNMNLKTIRDRINKLLYIITDTKVQNTQADVHKHL